MFKNWKAICEISDRHVMWAIAMLDLDSDLGRRLIKQLPEFFTEENHFGPVPLSVIRANAEASCVRGGHDTVLGAAERPRYYGAIPLNMPDQVFCTSHIPDRRNPFPPLPEGISPEAKQGDIVTWGGKSFVVLENNEGCEEMCIVPAELIAVDL